jgi:uncharacterized protein (TIGR02246 family)
MPARTPEEIHQLWGAALNAGDLEALVALYEPEATVVAQPGEVVTGTEAIRQVLSGFVAMQPRIELRPRQVLVTGDLALLISEWTMQGTGPDGSPVEMAATTSDVARRQADGSWRMAIDNPYGT